MEQKKIFFSYSRSDASDFALGLYQDLVNHGANVWIDQADIKAGEKWDIEIEKALRDCNCVLFIISKVSVASDNVLDEVYFALNNRKEVIPILLHQCEVPYRIQRLQTIDFIKDYKSGFNRLLKTVKSEEKTEQPNSKKEEIGEKEFGELRVEQKKSTKETNDQERRKGFLSDLFGNTRAKIAIAGIAFVILAFVAWQLSKTKSNVVKDVDGNSYKTVKIGDQIWMAENLTVSHFRNGDIIDEAKTDEQWKKAGDFARPAWCYNEDNPNTSKEYGRLYNWYTVNDKRGLAPEGWHIPSDSEWTVLSNFLGGDSIAGSKLKATTSWDKNKDANNSSGFNARGSGYRYQTAAFGEIGRNGVWWSSTENGANMALRRNLYCDTTLFSRWVDDKRLGAAIRCIKD